VAAVVRNPRHHRRSAIGGDGGQHRGSRSSRRLWCQRGEQSQAIGRSRGGRSTKIHALADSEGRLYALLLTPGQTHDINGARALLASTALPACLIGDTAYDADDLRHFLATQGCKPVISLKPHRINKPAFDAEAYKQRNLIERAFCRIKDWRAIATRYDKTARNFLAGLSLAVTLMFWIR
jgi:transposase